VPSQDKKRAKTAGFYEMLGFIGYFHLALLCDEQEKN
jgi:hypothetical protein